MGVKYGKISVLTIVRSLENVSRDIYEVIGCPGRDTTIHEAGHGNGGMDKWMRRYRA
ncbi:hypothetical protein QI600_004109 [Salmonella enterica]|nr:hypothetical protein [Salmonella enterica]